MKKVRTYSHAKRSTRYIQNHSRLPFKGTDFTFFQPAPTKPAPHSVAFGKISSQKPAIPEQQREIPLSATGTGSPTSVSVFGGGQNVTLEGKTDASYDGGSFKTKNIKAKQAEGCEGCEEECVKITGSLISTFKVQTTVTLPSVNDYPELTKCQRQRVQSAIQNKLAPHEQDHVRRFKKYNGTVNTPLNLTICRSDFDSKVQEMHDTLAQNRQNTVQADSDSIDPFQIDVDLDCTDKPKK